MYNLDWARELCGSLQYTKVPLKESVHELVKLILIYIVFMTVTGGSVIILNYVSSKCEPDKQIQSDTMNTKDKFNNRVYDTINIKQR